MLNINWTTPKMLIAAEGKVLTNGMTYSDVVYLGVDEDVNNWSEINEEDVPKIEESEMEAEDNE